MIMGQFYGPWWEAGLAKKGRDPSDMGRGPQGGGWTVKKNDVSIAPVANLAEPVASRTQGLCSGCFLCWSPRPPHLHPRPPAHGPPSLALAETRGAPGGVP